MTGARQRPKIFVFTAGGADAAGRLTRSVEQGFSAALPRAFAPTFGAAGALPPEGRLHVWGARPSPRNVSNWETLEPGDLGLGYAEGRFRVVGRLASTLYAPELATYLWGLARVTPEALMYLLEDVHQLELPRQPVLEALEYSPRFVPRGLFVPTDEHQPGNVDADTTPEELARFLSDPSSEAVRLVRPATQPKRPEDRPHATSGGDRAAVSPRPEPRRPVEWLEPLEGIATWSHAVGRELSHAAQPSDEPPLPDGYAAVQAPASVVVGEEFELSVGLGDEPQPGLGGTGKVERPEGRSDYSLTVHVVAPGFALREGERWRVALPVSREEPFPTTALHLTPEPIEGDRDGALIKVLYSVAGETLGLAVKALEVVSAPGEGDSGSDGGSGDDRGGGDPPPPPPEGPSLPLRPSTGEDAPDVTARIVKSRHEHELDWTFESRWPQLDLPDEPLSVNVGARPQEFALGIVKDVDRRKHKPDIGMLIEGKGGQVAAKVPKALWELLREATELKREQWRLSDPPEDASPPRPTVQILTDDPHVPWELATMAAPLIADGEPRFLGAQACVGRWILVPETDLSGLRPAGTQVSDAAIVTGAYEPALPQAAAEAQHLLDTYRARRVEATLAELTSFLRDDRAAQLLHFAVHGEFDPGGDDHGLRLADKETLPADSVQAANLDGAPFVFLNACEVGSSEEVLGSYAGMAAAFLLAGASAVVAPLWAINDETAKQIAIGFYESAGNGGAVPAEFLREQRAANPEPPASRTYLAYLFYGHPGLRIAVERKDGRG